MKRHRYLWIFANYIRITRMYHVLFYLILHEFILIVIFYLFQFSDKMEVIEDTIKETVKHIEDAEPISAHPDKLRSQIAENNVNVLDNGRSSLYHLIFEVFIDFI